MPRAEGPAARSMPNARDKSGESEKRRCVMVIDDDSTVRAMLQAGLGKRYRVVGLSNGEEVVELIESYGPQLLLLDINLPGSDGFEICRQVRAKALLNKLPILFMTGRKDDKSFLNSLDSGGNAYITKPFEIPALRERIEYLLPRQD